MSLITIPAYPPAPQSIEFALVSTVGMTRSPFTGAQQVIDWGAQWLECSVTMPPLKATDAQNWFQFLQLLRGPANTFHFSAAFVAAYPWILEDLSLNPLTWRLKTPDVKFSLTGQRVFGLNFEAIQVL